MKIRIISMVFCIVAMISVFAVTAFSAENEAVYVTIGEFSESSVLKITESSYKENQIHIKGINMAGCGHDVAVTVYSDINNMSIETLKAMRQQNTLGDGSFSFAFGIDGCFESGVIMISSDNLESPVYATLEIIDAEHMVLGLNDKYAELCNLLEKCKNAGIPVEYETAAATVIDKFGGFLYEDIKNSDSSRIEHHLEILTNTYNETKKNLLAYLEGEKVAKYVPRYVTGETILDGSVIIGNTAYDGKNEERPVFLIGFGHWDYAQDSVSYFSDMGVNFLHAEIGPNAVLFHPDVAKEWEFNTVKDGFLKLGSDAVLTNKDKNSGSFSISMVNNTSYGTSGVVGIKQEIDVKPNTTYTYGFYLKGENMSESNYYYLGNSGRKRVGTTTGGVFKKYSGTYTTGSDETKVVFAFATEGVNTEILIDDVYVREWGYQDNLILNGGFEDGEADKENLVEGFKVKYDKINYLKNGLKDAEENNVAVTLLLSPHYFPGYLSAYDETINDSGSIMTSFMPMNPTHPTVQHTLEVYLDILIPEIIGYKSLDSIIIANEPAFAMGLRSGGETSGNTYYLEKWREWLKNKYNNDISALNTLYKTNYGAFSDVLFSSWSAVQNSIGKEPKSIDYIEFNNSILYDFHKYMVEKIRSYNEDIKIHTKMMDYLPATDETNELNKHLESGNNYEMWAELFDINGCDTGTLFSSDDSKWDTLEDELMWYDFMRSIKDAPVYNTEDHIIGNAVYEGDIDYREELTMHVGAVLWQGAVHGKNGSAIWQWNREKSYINGSMRNSAFALRPAETLAVGKTALDMNRLSKELAAIQKREARVAIFYSEDSFKWQTNYPNALFEVYKECIYNGEKVEFVTDMTPEKINEKNFDIVIAPQIKNANPKVLEEFRKYVNDSGKLLLLGSEPLKRDIYNRVYSSDEYSDIVKKAENIRYTWENEYYVYDTKKEIKNKISEYIDNYIVNDNKVILIDTETGEKVDGVEWVETEYDGNVLLSIYNFDKTKSKTVRILYNNNEVTKSYDLIDGDIYNREILLTPMNPLLLNITDIKDAVNVKISKVSFNGVFSKDGTNVEVSDYDINIPQKGEIMAAFEIPEDFLDKDEEISAIITVYSGEKLIDFEMVSQNVCADKGGVLKAVIDIENVDENTKVKAFLWNNKQNPLCNVKTIEIIGGTK